MIKKYLLFFIIILFTGCSAPGTALLGPAVTGATTKSVAQASLSFGTNQIVKKIHIMSKNSENKIAKVSMKIDDFTNYARSKNLFKFHK